MTADIRPIRAIFLDLEFTGIVKDPASRIRQLAAYDPSRVGEEANFSVLLNPLKRPEEFNFHDHTKNLKTTTFSECWPRFKQWVLKDAAPNTHVVIVAHNNYEADKPMLEREIGLIRPGYADPVMNQWRFFCTLRLANMVSNSESKSLQALRTYYRIDPNDAHQARDDVQTLHKVFLGMLGKTDPQVAYQGMLDLHPLKAVASAIKVNRAVVPIFYDTETTGLIDKDPSKPLPRIVELAAYTPTRKGNFARFSTLINPGVPIPKDASKIHGITDDDVKSAPSTEAALGHFRFWATNNKDRDAKIVMIAHNNINYDKQVLEGEFKRVGIPKFNCSNFDTLIFARKFHAGLPDFRKADSESKAEFTNALQSLRVKYQIPEDHAHRAMGDVNVMFGVWEAMLGDTPRDEVLQAMAEPYPAKTHDLVLDLVKKYKGTKRKREDDEVRETERPAKKAKLDEKPIEVEMKDIVVEEPERKEEVAFVPGGNDLGIAFNEDDFI